MKPMKPIRAWAICESSGRLALFCGYLPLFWNRKAAEEERGCHLNRSGCIVRVEVREVPKKAKVKRA